MFTNFDQAQAFIKQNRIRMVDLKFSDLWGRWHHVTITASEFTPSIMENGVGFDGSSVGFKSVRAGDMVLVPDLSTGIHGSLFGKFLLLVSFATQWKQTRKSFSQPIPAKLPEGQKDI